MDGVSWWQSILLGILGGGSTKVVEYVYAHFWESRVRAREASQVVEKHLDPLLKAADELCGKLRSLAGDQFKELRRDGNAETLNLDFLSLLFLFGSFWGRVEIIRREGLSVAMGSDERGKNLIAFLDCLESQNVRLVDRISQRAVGEVFMKEGSTIGFVEFAKSFEEKSALAHWITPLVTLLSRLSHTTERQRLIQYGTVVHALIDTLDPEHLVTRNRPSMASRLSAESWKELRYRVFGVYLKFVKDKEKYLGPPKKAAPKKG